MSTTAPPPLAVITQPPPPQDTASPYFSSAAATWSSIITVITIIASAVIVSASIYLLLRFLSRRFHRSFSASADDVVFRHDASSNQQQFHVASNGLLDSLPLFTFRSVTPNIAGDCAVCLSTVVSSGCDVLDKILSAENRGKSDTSLREGNGNGGSFRIEIGSISRRRGAESNPETRRSYSVGSFEYIVDDNEYEVSVGSTSTHSRGVSDSNSNGKESSVGISIPVTPAEVSGGRSWLDRLASFSISSRTMSFRSSGRFFSGSSRRSEAVVVPEDLEAYRVGEEISEIFRWLSGI
ncbi:hypothetical protein DH2020_044654 [Rehmannia glutinosa]|uniref:Uncharacterized protein n=1 Tax=Rehmannia glutinosa TaxID=99300 RepID=A0ABR0UGB8_REHGL